ncbi:hypothetical protein GOV10_04330 [Candidatus Woesearchaeota archaeon]|nr:hypothetical protein [Candidatus Woesearchaeota archaeon]
MPCIYCASEDIYCVQKRKTKTGEHSIIRCRACKRRHTPQRGFARYRHDPFVIFTALRLKKSGYTLGQIQRNLSVTFRVNVTRKTVLDWVNKLA